MGACRWPTDRIRGSSAAPAKRCWKLIRYADDFVVIVSGQRSHAEALLERGGPADHPVGAAAGTGEDPGRRIDEGFVFLGFNIRRMRKRGNRISSTSTPGRPARRSKRSAGVSGPDLQINAEPETWVAAWRREPDSGGWANYFRHGCRSGCSTSWTPTHGAGPGWIRRKHGIRWPGFVEFCCPGPWRFAHNGVGSPAHPASK